jgi:hypothetical protein
MLILNSCGSWAFTFIQEFTEDMGTKVHAEDIAMVYKCFAEAASQQQSFSF